MANIGFDDLKKDLTEIGTANPRLKADERFVLWFLKAFLCEDEAEAAQCLTGGSHDKGIDAVVVDEDLKQVSVIQGKFHEGIGEVAEKRSDVISFSQLASTFFGPKKALDAFYDEIDPLVRAKVEKAVERLRKRNYSLQLYYVTTGRCSNGLTSEAMLNARYSDGPAQLDLVGGHDVLRIFTDYLDGVAPPVRELDFPLESEGRIRNEGVLKRYDPTTGITAWVFSMTGNEMGQVFEKAGIRLFARNVRGFLGRTDINDSIRFTLEHEADNFWYFNNGVTLVCDLATRIQEGGREFFRVRNPQIINGQQTTRQLHMYAKKGASVLVRLIQIPRTGENGEHYFDKMVSNIVKATNWQNEILASDLMANDRRQVVLEKELRKLGYQYIRKRQTKSEARRAFGRHYHTQIRKDELAQAVAACELDPAIVRRGKEGLFEERYYGTIFNAQRAGYYLARYWLMRAIQNRSRGYPERAYAKWLVLNFAWTRLSGDLGGIGGSARFRKMAEALYGWPKSLEGAIDATFRAALLFYRLNRGEGEQRKDVSTFFQGSGLNREFNSFWRGSRNVHRAPAEKRYLNFLKELRAREDS
ncbi:MAG TPA: AIPR family protein [Thermoplasmata archaeon]